MGSNREYIERFMTRSFEKNVDFYILSDKKYVVPKQEVNDYIHKVLAIPYFEFIDYAREHEGIIENDQLTQSSSFAACTSDMCKALEIQGNPGMSFVDIGQLFPQYVKARNEGAFRKYGENQIKTSTQLGLTFEYYGLWFLTCVGYIFNELEEIQQKSLLARTILRIPLYKTILTKILEEDVDLTEYMQSLSDSTKGRRSGSILRMINLCLDECRKEGIGYHNLFYPNYNAREKKLIMAIQDGYERNDKTLEIDFSQGKNTNRLYHAAERMIKPRGSMLYEVEADDEVRRLVHNMMELYEGTTILQIVTDCQKEFQQKYFSMKVNDWRHLIRDYVRMVTERSNLQEEKVFRYVMAG